MNEIKPTVLVVDDYPDNIDLIRQILKDEYKVKVSTNGKTAIDIARASKPDLILMDIMMPIMDGYETCEIIKRDESLHDIPIIFITAKNETEDETKAFQLGAVDYITKPINAIVMLSRVKAHIALKHEKDEMVKYNSLLEKKIISRTKEITCLQELTIMAMASLAEIRDNETGMHLKRTKLYVKELAECMASMEKFNKKLPLNEIKLIVASAPLHDIGKVGIPDAILLKAGKLTSNEYEIMKNHTKMGWEALEKAETFIEEGNAFLRYAKDIALYHHEAWNGKGYGFGLSGDEIPLSARIMSVADVYDALTSKRVYKEEMTHEEAVKIIKQASGEQFDPDVVEAFLRCKEKFKEISIRNKD